MTHRFVDHVALVTGAGSGIGAATALAFARAGAAVVVADINEKNGSAIAAGVRDGGGHAEFVRADVTRVSDVNTMIDTAVRAFGGLHVAANVAGGMGRGDRGGLPLHLTGDEQWDATQALNLRSTWLCLKAEITHMLDHGGGAIVNVASVAGMLATRDASLSYSVAKAGIIHLTRLAAVTYAGDGIRVNAIAPGLTATEGVRASLTPDQQVPRGHVIKRMVEPAEQAAAILWLCSDEAAMTTGHVLPVDGGWTAR